MWFTTFDSNLLISVVLGLQKVQHCFKNFSTPEKIMQEKSLYCWKKNSCLAKYDRIFLK